MKFFRLWLPVVIWAALIFCFSNIPHLKTNLKYDFILRKIAHVFEYFILTFLLHRAFKDSFNLNTFYLLIYPFSLSFLYAVSDEVHQLFVPGRVCSIRDILTDAIGIAGFYITINIFRINQKSKTIHHV